LLLEQFLKELKQFVFSSVHGTIDFLISIRVDQGNQLAFVDFALEDFFLNLEYLLIIS